jgi:predicted alpha/beta hydrolase family esterase
MTKQILFIQGGGAGTHDEWDNKLVASLTRELGQGYDIRYPRMPNEAEPSYGAWKKAIEQEIAALDEAALVVGHSVGGTILVNALAEQPSKRKLAGVFLISAPFVGPGGWPSEDIEPSQDLGARLPHATPIYLYHGSEDETAPCAHVDLYKQSIPQAHVRKLDGRDHQLNDDLSEVAADITGRQR